MPERIEIVHPNGTRTTIVARLLPGWRRMGWLPASEVDEPAPKTPAHVPDKTDGLAAGTSSTPSKGAQP